MIQILPEAAWREFRSSPKSRGQNQTTHQALIVDQHGQEHKCFVKASPENFPMAFTEAFGWLVADALDLPRPKFAALLHLPVHKLRRCMPLDQHWMRINHALAFCSSTVEGKHITSPWRWIAHIRASKAFKHEDVARIAAFDMWMENQDRHTGNFLRTRDGDYIPIDNELILYTLVWVAAGFSYGHNSLQKQAQAVLKLPGYTQFQVSMVLASKLHESALAKSTPTLRQFILAMVADPVHAAAAAAGILQFLDARAHPDWLVTELGLIP